MPKRNGRRLTLSVSTMVAVGALGLLVAPTPATAAPPIPRAPACTQYGFNGGFAFRQSNGFVVDFGRFDSGQVLPSRVFATSRRDFLNATKLEGGFFDGRSIEFIITWDDGTAGRYSGDVGDDGRLHGFTGEMGNNHSATWDSVEPLRCIR